MGKREFIIREDLTDLDNYKVDGGKYHGMKLGNAFSDLAITEQDIVKPYLDKITEHLGNLITENMEVRGSTIEPNQYAYCYQEILEFIDNLLSEQGETDGDVD